MKTYKVTFQNGDSLVTDINVAPQQALDYYLNNWFNFGDTESKPYDVMVKGVSVEELL